MCPVTFRLGAPTDSGRLQARCMCERGWSADSCTQNQFVSIVLERRLVRFVLEFIPPFDVLTNVRCSHRHRAETGSLLFELLISPPETLSS